MHGSEEVLRFIQAGLHVWWASGTLEEATITGTRGFLFRDGGDTGATASFERNDAGQLTDVFIMRNPDQLERTEPAATLPGSGNCGTHNRTSQNSSADETTEWGQDSQI